MIIEGMQQTILQSLSKRKDILSVIIGQEKAKLKIMASLLAGHHVLIEGPPGVGKTTLVKHLASSLPSIDVVKGCAYHCHPPSPVCPLCKTKVATDDQLDAERITGERRFIRIQGSPDLTPEDLLGDIDPVRAFKYGPQDYKAFTPGKLLKGNRGIVFFDELNRVSEKLQNALLQVLEEGIATIGPYDVDYPAEFTMMATMNPRERAGVEELSDVLLDRFDVVKMGYPESSEREKEILIRYGNKFEGIDISDEVIDQIVAVVRSTRQEPWKKELDQGASVRATLALYEKAQALALLQGHRSVRSEDVGRVVTSSLSSRIKPSPESRFYDDPFGFIEALVADISPGSFQDVDQ